MIQPLITATLFALAGAGVGLVGYMAIDPLTFTSSVREHTIAADRSPPVVPARAPMTLEAETSSILLAEVQITAAPPKAAKQPAVAAELEPAELEPCTEWRRVGEFVVDHDIPVGVRNVRVRCARPDDVFAP